MVCRAVCYGRKQQGYWLGSFCHQIWGTRDSQSPEKCPSCHNKNPFISIRLLGRCCSPQRLQQSHQYQSPAHFPPHPCASCLLHMTCHNGHPKVLSKCLFLIKNDPDLSSMRDLPAFPTLCMLWFAFQMAGQDTPIYELSSPCIKRSFIVSLPL